MTAVFPQAPIGAGVDLRLGGTWTTLIANPKTYVYQRDPITVTRGRVNEASRVNPSQCTMTLNNRDGRFSFNNPLGAWYGSLVRNTPLRASLPNSLLPSPYNTTYLRLEDDAASYASCPAAARIELTGSLDIRVDVDVHGYGPVILAGIWDASAVTNQRSWAMVLTPLGQIGLYFSTNGNNAPFYFAYSPSQTPLPLGRLVVRATLDVTAGAVSFYYAAAGQIDGSAWTQLSPTLVGNLPAAPFTIFSSTSAALRVGYSPGLEYDIDVGFENAWLGTTGSVYDFELRSGIGGTIVAKAAFNTQTAGATSWTDSPGNTWSLSGTATLDNRTYRFHGELTALPKNADPTLSDVYTKAVASGVLQRLQQGQNPLRSAFYRAVVAQTLSPPIAYWPCEDKSGAALLGSAVSGGVPMLIGGPSPQLASNTAFACSAALPVVASSTWSGTVTSPGVTWAANVLRFLMNVPAGGDTNNAIIARMWTTGTVARADIVYTTASSGQLTINCYNSVGTLLMSAGPVSISGPGGVTVGVNGQLALVDAMLTVSGSGVQCSIGGFTVGATSELTALNTIATGSIGAVTQIQIDVSANLASTAIGHIHVGAQSSQAQALANPLGAWNGETAGNRVQRLCAEQGLNARVYGHPGLSAPMGTQPIDTFMNILQQCEDTDRGMLYEPGSCLGIAYRPLWSLCNQPATAVASFTGAQLGAAFATTTDDQSTANDITVSNTDGASARQVLAAGAMSTAAPPNGVGPVATSVSVNAGSDGQLPSIANWMVHVATDAHDRAPVLPFDMARSQTPAAIALLDCGSRLQVVNPPPWVQYDPIDQLAGGFTETFGPLAEWKIGVNAVPGYPYTVAEAAGGVSPATHVDTDGSTLTSTVTSAATGLSFTTTNPATAPWTSDPSQFPFDVAIGGERITVAGPGTCLGTDPFLAQGAAQYSPDQSTVVFDTSVPWNVDGASDAAFSTGALLVTPFGSPQTRASVLGAVSAAGTVATSTGYTLWAWVYATASRTYVLAVNWYLNGVYVSTSLSSGTAVPAGVWTFVTGTVTSPASGVNEMQTGVQDNASPTPAQTFRAWGINAARTSTITAASPQAVTGIRAVNGVSKSQSAGADVRLWFPPIAGL